MLEKQKNVIRYKYTTSKDDDNYGIILINLDTKEIEFEKNIVIYVRTVTVTHIVKQRKCLRVIILKSK